MNSSPRHAASPAREIRLAKLAAATLGGSMLMAFALLAIYFLSAYAASPAGRGEAGILPTALIAAALAGACFTQIYLLHTIGRHAPARRLRTWQASLLAHAATLAAACWFAGHPLVLLLLIPEVISTLLHLPGLYLASKSVRTARGRAGGRPQPAG